MQRTRKARTPFHRAAEKGQQGGGDIPSGAGGGCESTQRTITAGTPLHEGSLIMGHKGSGGHS